MKRLFTAASILLFVSLAFGQVSKTINLAWDDTANPAGTKYRVYHKTTAAASYIKDCTTADTANCRDAGTNKTYAWTGAGVGTHLFVVSAYNTSGESGYSNEVSQVIDPIPQPPTALKITSMSASLRWFGVVCMASTSVKTSSIFRYQRIAPNQGWTTVVTTPTPTKTQHRAVLYLTEPGYYNYTWQVADAGGATAEGSGTFQYQQR